mmetsp:Transcript_440/g.720  ORF Transcript_440/g.720 Transcript_440/m.720 type:complete len:213 (+) Transcript_440:404-1042(+)
MRSLTSAESQVEDVDGLSRCDLLRSKFGIRHAMPCDESPWNSSAKTMSKYPFCRASQSFAMQRRGRGCRGACCDPADVSAVDARGVQQFCPTSAVKGTPLLLQTLDEALGQLPCRIQGECLEALRTKIIVAPTVSHVRRHAMGQRQRWSVQQLQSLPSEAARRVRQTCIGQDLWRQELRRRAEVQLRPYTHKGRGLDVVGEIGHIEHNGQPL